MSKTLKTVVVEHDEFSEWDFIPPGSFYIRNAKGDYVFMKTSKRQDAQDYVNTEYGKGKYTVIPCKVMKSESRLESGEFSCRGTSTRRGQKKY